MGTIAQSNFMIKIYRKLSSFIKEVAIIKTKQKSKINERKPMCLKKQ